MRRGSQVVLKHKLSLLTVYGLCFYLLYSVTGNSLDEQLDAMGLNKEMFHNMDLFTLTSSNFSSLVLDSFEPWVVVLHRGEVSADWKEAAVKSRGVVCFGMVNLDTEKHLIKEMAIKDPESITKETDKARVYPFGQRAFKVKKTFDVSKATSALIHAVQSLPTESIQLIQDAEELNDFLMEGIITSPSRFPSIFIYERGQHLPPEFISIAIHLKRYFNFGRLDTAVAHELVSVGVDRPDLQAPSLVVLVSKLDDSGKLIHKGIRCRSRKDSKNEEPYDKDVPSYPELLECLYNINRRAARVIVKNNYDDY